MRRRVLLLALLVSLVYSDNGKNNDKKKFRKLAKADPAKKVIETNVEERAAARKNIVDKRVKENLEQVQKGVGAHLSDVRHRKRRHHELPVFTFYLLFFIMIAFQVGLHWWKKKHNKSYLMVTLLGLLGFPFYLCVRLGYWRLIFCWFWFACSSGYFVFKSREVPLDPLTPRKIYSWFYGVYKVCNSLALFGYMLVVAECLGFGFALGVELMSLGMTLMFYGLYFGVLGRDSCELCCDLLVSTLGYTSKGGLPLRTPRPNTCALCTLSLTPSKFDGSVEDEAQIKLSCGHILHEGCVKGWCMVGKKDTCPVCHEKVDLSLYKTSPWDKQERTWTQLLDALRYLIVWNPIMILSANFLFQGMGIPTN